MEAGARRWAGARSRERCHEQCLADLPNAARRVATRAADAGAELAPRPTRGDADPVPTDIARGRRPPRPPRAAREAARHLAAGRRSVRGARAMSGEWLLPAEATPPLAAHIITPRGGYPHHGLYVG